MSVQVCEGVAGQVGTPATTSTGAAAAGGGGTAPHGWRGWAWSDVEGAGNRGASENESPTSKGTVVHRSTVVESGCSSTLSTHARYDLPYVPSDLALPPSPAAALLLFPLAVGVGSKNSSGGRPAKTSSRSRMQPPTRRRTKHRPNEAKCASSSDRIRRSVALHTHGPRRGRCEWVVLVWFVLFVPGPLCGETWLVVR